MIAAYEAIRALNPDIVISAGTCGGFLRKGLDIGDVVLGLFLYVLCVFLKTSTYTCTLAYVYIDDICIHICIKNKIGTHSCYHDRRIPIPGFTEFGINKQPLFHSSKIVKVCIVFEYHIVYSI